jgi:hypothetical protein
MTQNELIMRSQQKDVEIRTNRELHLDTDGGSICNEVGPTASWVPEASARLLARVLLGIPRRLVSEPVAFLIANATRVVFYFHFMWTSVRPCKVGYAPRRSRQTHEGGYFNTKSS